MDMEGVLAITFIFGGGTLFLLSVSPVGKALAERIRNHGARPAPDPELLAEVDALARRDVRAARADGFRRAPARPASGAGQDRGGRVSHEVFVIVLTVHCPSRRGPSSRVLMVHSARRSRPPDCRRQGDCGRPTRTTIPGSPISATRVNRSWRSVSTSPSACCCRNARRASSGMEVHDDAGAGRAGSADTALEFRSIRTYS